MNHFTDEEAVIVLKPQLRPASMFDLFSRTRFFGQNPADFDVEAFGRRVVRVYLVRKTLSGCVDDYGGLLIANAVAGLVHARQVYLHQRRHSPKRKKYEQMQFLIHE